MRVSPTGTLLARHSSAAENPVMQSTRWFAIVLICACAAACLPGIPAAAEDDSELEELLNGKGDREAAQTKMDVTLELMRHGHARDRISAIWKGRIHTLEPEFYDRIAEQLGDKDPAIVSAAASALGEMGKKKAVEPLLKVLRGSSGWVQESAAYALGLLGDNRAAAAQHRHEQAFRPARRDGIRRDARRQGRQAADRRRDDLGAAALHVSTGAAMEARAVRPARRHADRLRQ